MGNASPICYGDPKKPYSIELCEAFAHGANGRLDLSRQYSGEPALISGMGAWQKALMDQCKEFWQADHGYLGRGRYFKISRNALWCSPELDPDYRRLSELRIEFRKPIRRRSVVIATQSESYYTVWRGMSLQEYLGKLITKVRQHTTRNVVVRYKPKYGRQSMTIEDQLRDAYCLVTDSSGTALDALIGGVPVIVTNPDYPAAKLSGTIEEIEDIKPPDPNDVAELLAVLAANQWTIPEMRSGKAWHDLQNRKQRANVRAQATS